MLGVGVDEGVPLNDGVLLVEEVGLDEQVGTSPTLPAGQAEGHPQAVQATLEVAPVAALYVPAEQGVQDDWPVPLYVPATHCVGAAELSGQ